MTKNVYAEKSNLPVTMNFRTTCFNFFETFKTEIKYNPMHSLILEAQS